MCKWSGICLSHKGSGIGFGVGLNMDWDWARSHGICCGKGLRGLLLTGPWGSGNGPYLTSEGSSIGLSLKGYVICLALSGSGIGLHLVLKESESCTSFN